MFRSLNYRSLLTIALVLATSSLVGCGDSASPEPVAQSGGSSATNAASPKSALPTDPAERVVYEFLDALAKGKTDLANSNLTPIALELLQKNDSCIVMPASDTARFRVGKVEQHDSQRATVDAVWSDLDVDGNRVDEVMLWALRLIEGKWRVSGMVADPNSENPVICDFENPTEYGQPAGSQTPDISRQAQQGAVDPFQQGVVR